ncbi:tRNA lysidine(34) synthetase TilS [Marinovum sp.]|uniref:tRNA lysidine(34) synthetase TilS n=1 Tax=Marinovum sp. TaxID=2024839 RepID=UPI002B27318D|nr:tRNA lysidine(34) synthetase TilS [Marinovum sp.]
MTSFSLESHFAGVMGDLLGPGFPAEIGLAVSGGGDSMALLTLAHNWTRRMGVGLRVVTVDHGLRSESAGEAAFVARECAAMGHAHDILRWQDWDGSGNLQEAARAARLRLIGAWRGDLQHVLMAHTLDDQAETVLMRLARGSGVDGLAGMAARRFVAEEEGTGFWLLRPLLEVRRAELRHYLTVLKGHWIEDPSNGDARFERVRVRQALEVLAPLGLDAPALAETAGRMARAQAALRARACEAADRVVRQVHGDLLYDRDGLATLDDETRMRLLAAGLQFVSGQVYRPRARALAAAAGQVASGGTATLHGCLMRAERSEIRICREYAAVAEAVAPVGGLWDGRLRLSGAGLGPGEVRALGAEGASQLSERPSGLPYQSLIAQPAVFDGPRLVAFAPAGVGPAHEIHRRAGAGGFSAFLAVH